MRNYRIVRQRRLVKGGGIVDTLYSYGRNTYAPVRNRLIGTIKSTLRSGARYGVNELAKQGHNAVNTLESQANQVVANVLGSGLSSLVKSTPARVNRNLILREITQSLRGGGASKRKVKFV